ncbi:amidase [Alphaproteobacteria bacterium GH1-50]|uniref:Amidase n=1 Tax=Kangsaoukella pontilimi TaxID=2691042 RepID=A0A7C9II72_9RHOB|nr:amidase [Kangsaoukella pontilimi]MXQ09568.1 amidase [Kangsaoukella pontilimi]
MLDDDIPAGANGFHPDPDAWGRYGGLVHSTIDALARAETAASPTDVPQPASSASATAQPSNGVGYGARGWGDLCDQVAALKSGSTTAEAEVEAALATAEARDGSLFGVVALEAERALLEARAIDGKPAKERGALAGAPYARKDLFFRKGFGAECGAPLFAGQIADETATILERLDGADGVDIGRLAMAELAMSPTGFNVHTKHPRNPWNSAHVTGGSSSGSAVAVAGGYVRMALGTDTGGSIRHPAAMSGITGLKPTSNRISRAGVWPLSWSLDCVGPLARSARDCALILDIVSGPDPRDTTVSAPRFRMPDLSGDLSRVRIAVPSGYYFDTATPAISSALDAAMEELKIAGATIVQTESPDMALVNAMAHIVLAVEASAQLGEAFRDPNCNVGRQVRDRLEPGLFYSATAYATALRLRPAIRSAWLSGAMADCDAVLIPAVPREVPTIAETTEGDPAEIGKVIGAVTHATRGINYLGLPSLALPCGQDASGLPIAFQLVGRADDEATLIRVGDAYQQATDWHLRTPWKG